MKLSLSQIKSVTLGAERVREEEDGIHFYRFTEREEELYRQRNEELYKKTFSTSGIQLSFRTDSRTLFLQGKLTAGSSRRYYAIEVFVGDKRVDCIKNFEEESLPDDYAMIRLPRDVFEKSIALPEGEKHVRVLLPWSCNTIFSQISLDDGASLEPCRPEKNVLIFGDSITHGYDALYPSHRYVTLLADHLHAQEWNKAIGGEIFFPELAAEKVSFKPDYVSVAYGTNDWKKCTPDEIRVNSKAFFAALAENYPESVIYAITPIWRADREDSIPKTIHDIIVEATSPYANIRVIRGIDLVGHDPLLFADLRLHPNDRGFLQYGENLIREIG